jgi:Tol biopolymer transport system component
MSRYRLKTFFRLLAIASSVALTLFSIFWLFTRLPNPKGIYHLALSPDGKQIAFVGSQYGKRSLFLIDSDATGMNDSNSYFKASEIISLAWSPTSQDLLAAVLEEEEETENDYQVYSVKVNSSKSPRILADGKLVAWTADQKVVVALTRGTKTEIHLVSPNKSTKLKLLEIEGSIENLSCSSKANYIAFTAQRNDAPDYFVISDVYIINAKTAEKVKKLENASNPVWSPDGEMIVYYYNDGLYVLNINTSTSVKVAEVSAKNYNHGLNALAWSPNGQFIAYSATNCSSIENKHTCSSDIHLLSLKMPLKSVHLTPGRSPSWSPDSKSILFVLNDRISAVEVDNLHALKIKRIF